MIGKRLCTAVLVAAAAMTAGVVAAPVASAGQRAPLQVTITSCESGAAQFICLASITGGTAPYTKTWVNLRNAYFIQGGRGRCNAGSVQLRIDVSDAVGNQASASDGFACNLGPWP